MLALTALPALPAAAAPIILEVGGAYAYTEAGLRDAIAAANDGDTIKLTGSGTLTVASRITISKRVTLELNNKILEFTESFEGLSIAGAGVTIAGPGTITMKSYVWIGPSAALTIQGGAVIEGTEMLQSKMTAAAKARYIVMEVS